MTDPDLFMTPGNPDLDKIILRRNPDKLSTELDRETVILDMDSGVYKGLDETGTAIWKLLEKEIKLVDLIAALLQDYNIDEQTCRAETISFLRDLAKSDLLIVRQ